MSITAFLIIAYILAFMMAAALMEGSSRRNYLIVLTILVAAGVVNDNPALRSRVELFISHFQKGTSVKEERSVAAAPLSLVRQTVPFKPFFVYQDKNSLNHFAPSGFMPDGDCLNVDDAWQADTQSGSSAIRIVYDIACSRNGKKWAGVYWQNPPNNWGSQKGGYDLRGATKLVFWARGENGGERIEEFRVGGMGAKEIYPDSAMAILAHVTLTREWKEYTIDLSGKDLSYISGGFAFSTNVDVNQDPCVFYLDEIRFE